MTGFHKEYDGAGTNEDAGKDAWTALVRVLVASCPKLQMLDVRANFIDAAGAEALACQLSQTCHELRKLDISNNCLGDAGAEAMGRHLAHGCRELRELHIGFHQIGATGAEALARHLADGCLQLRELDVRQNEIGATAAEALARHLAAGCRRLQKLDMWINPIGQAGAVAVARCVATGCPELQELDLRHIRDGGKIVDDKVLVAAVKAKLGPLKGHVQAVDLLVVATGGNRRSRVGSLGHYCCMQIYEHYQHQKWNMLPRGVVQLASQSDLGCSVLFRRIEADPGE